MAGPRQPNTRCAVAELDPRRARLAAALKRLRTTVQLTQPEMAQRTGWVQPKVSRLENGVQLPTESDIRAWAAETFATAEQTEELLDMLSAAHVEYTPTIDLLKRGQLARRQAHIGALEAAATRIGEYQPALVPGPAQTAAYRRALLALPGSARSKGASDAAIDGIVAGMLRRQQLLHQPGRTWQFLMGEVALWSQPLAHNGQLTQLEHLIKVAQLASVELGIIPLKVQMPIVPTSGFRLLDDEFVYVEDLHGERRLYGQDVHPFLHAFTAVRQAAVTGPDAVAVIQRVAAEVRRDVQL